MDETVWCNQGTPDIEQSMGFLDVILPFDDDVGSLILTIIQFIPSNLHLLKLLFSC